MQVGSASAAFVPLASSGFSLNQATQPSRSLLDGGGLRGASIVTDQGSYDVGVSRRVRWGGGRYDATWNSNRLESTNTFSNFNPSLAATASLTYTQPLLRGFRTDNERTQLVVSRIDRGIADIDLEETIVNTLADVRLAYWELVHAHAAAEVQRQSLALALVEQLVRDNRARVEIGMVGEIEVVQARDEAALRRQRWQRRFACCEPTSWPSSSSSSTAGLCTVRYPGNHADVDIAYVAPMSSSGPMLREYTITCIASIFPCPTHRMWWAGLYGCRT